MISSLQLYLHLCLWGDCCRPLDSFRTGIDCQKDQDMIRKKAGTFSPTPWPPGKQEGLEIKSAINGQWFNQQCLYNRTSMQALNDGVQRCVPGWWSHQRAGRVVCLSTPPPAPADPLPLYLALYISSIWQFPSCIFYNKLVIVSKKFLHVLWAILACYWTKKGLWKLPIYSWWVRTKSVSGLVTGIWIEGSLVELSP